MNHRTRIDLKSQDEDTVDLVVDDVPPSIIIEADGGNGDQIAQAVLDLLHRRGLGVIARTQTQTQTQPNIMYVDPKSRERESIRKN